MQVPSVLRGDERLEFVRRDGREVQHEVYGRGHKTSFGVGMCGRRKKEGGVWANRMIFRARDDRR